NAVDDRRAEELDGGLVLDRVGEGADVEDRRVAGGVVEVGEVVGVALARVGGGLEGGGRRGGRGGGGGRGGEQGDGSLSAAAGRSSRTPGRRWSWGRRSSRRT